MSETSSYAAIREAARLLENAGIEDPLANARRLMQLAVHDTGTSEQHLIGQSVSAEDVARFDALVQRRIAREPLQHIVGKTGFLNVEIKTDARALIPRGDTETVLLLACEQLQLDPFAKTKSDQALQIADLGTGSGAILAAALYELPSSRGIAIEQNSQALSLAKENFQRLGMLDRIDLFHGSWNDWDGWASCDLILSNPPYIRSDIIPDLEPEVCEYDPLDALDGGQDGLDAYREIIALAGAHMRSGAQLILEIGFDQKTSVSALLDTSGFGALRHQQDLGGNDRAIAATKT